MLAAKGTSVLRNVYVINRGYEDLAARLNTLGAQIETSATSDARPLLKIDWSRLAARRPS